MSPPCFAQYDTKSDAHAVGTLAGVVKASQHDREFGRASHNWFPRFPDYYGQVMRTHEFMEFKWFAQLKPIWNAEDVEAFSKQGDMENVKVYREGTVDSMQPTDRFKLTYIQPESYEVVGTFVAKATRRGTTSEAVFSVLAQTCLKKGGNVIYPLNEGVKRVLNPPTNIFFKLGLAEMNIFDGSPAQSSAGVLGFSYYNGSISYSHEPFYRVMVLKVSDETFEHLPVFKKKKRQKEVKKKQIKECDCIAEMGYPKPKPPCICLYYKGEEYFCEPNKKDKFLIVDEANPILTIRSSHPERVRHCGVEDVGYTGIGKPKKYNLNLEKGETRWIKIVGYEGTEKPCAQWCKVRRK